MSYLEPVWDVSVERDVQYATAPGYWSHAPENDRTAALRLSLHVGSLKPLPLEMDIYVPEGDGPDAGRPLLLMMHGGSFFVGRKEEAGQAGWCRHFAALGYVAASINYRLGFHADRQEIRQAEIRALEDADAALEYLLTRREALRINPRLVFAAGTSAGAITALNLAFRLYGGKLVDGVRPRLGGDFRIRAVANLWGAVRDLSVLEGVDVPILSFQSVNDPAVPYDEGYPLRQAGILSRLLADRMYGTHAIHEKAVSLGLRSEHHPCRETGHRLHLDAQMRYTPRFYEIRDAMAEFFASCIPPDSY